MKKVALSFSILAVTALITFGCKKDKNVAPEPDKEVQSSIDVAYAIQTISDLDMLCSFLGENQLFPKFYVPSANATGTMVPARDTVQKYLIESYNNTLCVDGKVRNGSVFMNYAFSNPNAKYYHDFEFSSKVSLSNYSVDGWKIKTTNNSQILISNLVTPVNYATASTNLSWSLKGDISFEHPTDSTKNMHLIFDLVKTLLNTSTPTVFPASKQAAINWSLAVVAYKGTMYGETSRTVPFKLAIDESHQLYRNFTCAPDKVYGIALTPSVSARVEEYHPFINGTASFTTAALYPRVIHFGPEESVPNSEAPCDNSGAITIKGISYPIDFKKEYK